MHRFGWLIFFVSLLHLASASAQVRVGFIEVRRPDGTLMQMEPGGRFVHIAISVGDQWLHAHPFRGVELVPRETLEREGTLVEVITVPNTAEPSPELLASHIGKTFNHDFVLSPETAYCSSLVGELLGIPPEPMVFDRALWPERFWKFTGQPGLSPDDIYRALRNRGLRPSQSRLLCSKMWRSPLMR